MVPTSTQAERSLKIQPLHRLNEVSKNGGASPPRTAFVHVPNFDQNRNFFQSRPLHRRSIHAERVQTSTQVERSFQKMAERLLHGRFRSLSRLWFKSKFYRSRPSPHNLWETTRGPRRLSYFTFILKLNKN
ncbi:hypothetical protein TNCV_233001 [Trichonephila clavipes]|nr:hypothetical protein TNCV_233001 [Trichonephila clavipes]